MFYLILLIVALVLYTWFKYETVSPKLIIKESATLTGIVVGATPELVTVTKNAIIVANKESEYAIRDSGTDAPVGFKLGRVVAKRETREYFGEFNTSCKTRSKELDELIDKL